MTQSFVFHLYPRCKILKRRVFNITAKQIDHENMKIKRAINFASAHPQEFLTTSVLDEGNSKRQFDE